MRGERSGAQHPVAQYADALDVQFDHIAVLQVAVLLEPAAGAHRA